MWDAEGKRYLDLTAAFGVAAAGHANPAVVRAGHDKARAGGLIASAGIIAPIIPPSIAFVIFTVLVPQVSVPALFAAGQSELPWGLSEYDYAGGLKGVPLQVTRGVYTDLLIPATAEEITKFFLRRSKI